jgi:hypothetical protein
MPTALLPQQLPSDAARITLLATRQMCNSPLARTEDNAATGQLVLRQYLQRPTPDTNHEYNEPSHTRDEALWPARAHV